MSGSAHFYLEPAAAFVRGRRPDHPGGTDAELVAWGRGAGLELHKFKRTSVLPRVRKVLGILKGIAPAELLDVGTGRGVFLWPCLEALPDLRVHCLEQLPIRVRDLQAVRAGGLDRLGVIPADVQSFELEPGSMDVATILEVLEHLERPEEALRRLLRTTRRFVVATVPSKPDNNPEHIHLFTRDSLTEMARAAGAVRVRIEYVLNHIVMIARSQGGS